MIIVTAETKVFGKERKIFRITVKGHSGYAEAGHDIVCAGVSSAFEYMANVIAANVLADSCEANADPKIPLAELKMKKHDGFTESLLNGFVEHVKNIESEFGQYIKVEIKDL